MRIPPRTLSSLAIVAALALTTSACGSDDESAGPSSAPSSTADDASDVEVPAGTTLDIFGRAATGAVGSLEGYEIDGSTITFDSTSITQAEGSSHCIILSTAAGGVGVPADTQVVIEYSDGSTTCDMS